MARKLPDPIVREPGETDEEFAARRATSKRRLQIAKRLYQSYFLWKSLRESGEVEDVITIEGEDWFLGDLLVGLDTLPRQQRNAFTLICLRNYTESAATAIILPNSRWTTPTQEYSDEGLRKMLAAYDAVQAGTWDKDKATKKIKKERSGRR